MSDDISRFWSAGVSELKAYVPGEQPAAPGWIKLNTNECPYPPSPRAHAEGGSSDSPTPTLRFSAPSTAAKSAPASTPYLRRR